jgi:hypothetical protein
MWTQGLNQKWSSLWLLRVDDGWLVTKHFQMASCHKTIASIISLKIKESMPFRHTRTRKYKDARVRCQRIARGDRRGDRKASQFHELVE